MPPRPPPPCTSTPPRPPSPPPTPSGGWLKGCQYDSENEWGCASGSLFTGGMDKGGGYNFGSLQPTGACAGVKDRGFTEFQAGGASVQVDSPDGRVTAIKTFGHLYPGAEQPRTGGCGTCFLVKSKSNNGKCIKFE